MQSKIIEGVYCEFYGPWEGPKRKKKRKEKARKMRRALERCYVELTPLFETEYAICRNSQS